ncbi:MAG TPA: putative Ig domain-containing protein [Terracidiphilus sp.]|nr:putative Ig domain-containing protein [Terracidiphilus sp.]
MITGTVTAACAGTYSPVFTMTDSGAPTKLTATVTLNMTIAAAPAMAFTGAVPATATYNSAYVGSAAATGGAGALTYSVLTGALPTGLSLNPATGAITGTPTAVGNFAFTVKAADAFGDSLTQGYSITVNPATPILAFVAIAAHTYGDAPFSVSASSASAGVVTYSVTSGPATIAGNLVTITGAGTVVLGASQAATTNYTSATASTSFTVNPETPTLTFAAIPTQTFGDPSFTVSATSASSGTVTYSVTSGPATIAGNTVTTTGAGTVVLGASQAASGNYGAATASTSFTVNPALSITTPASLKSGTINLAYSQQLSASGGSGTGYTWVTTGANNLASFGLTLSSTGLLSSANLGSSTGTVSFTAQVTDSQSHTASTAFTFSVYNVLTITTTTLPSGTVGSPYSQTLTAGGGTGANYTWSATSSNLASYGLSLSSAGVITGSPTQTGTASFTANLTDSGSNTATPVALTITIYSALSLPTPSSSVPGPGTTGSLYSGQITASGGSGTYSWTVTGLPSDGLSAALSGSTQQITGTPTSATTVTFNVTVTDTVTSQSVGPYAYSIVVSNPATLTLPTPNPSSLPSATNGQLYSGAINATGGASPYVWTVNGSAVPTNGSTVALASGLGLSVSNTGGNSLSVGGTPTGTGTVTFTASIKDNLGTVVGPNTYTVAVNSAGSQVSGQITLTNKCGNGGSAPGITVTLSTSPGGTVVQTATTDSSGNYSFASVPNGTYTITPSITGPSSVFYPATLNVTVNNSALSGESFGAMLGYTVSGTVSYGGSNTGRVYVQLNNTSCSGNSPGTSISAPGSFTIHGVQPGTYTPVTWMDTLNDGQQNTSNPSGTGSNVTITSANVTGASVPLTDNTPTAVPTSNPSLAAITGGDQGVMISFKAAKNSGGVEAATSYDVQFSTSSSFTSGTTYNFKADGTSSNIWILGNSTSGITGSPFTNGQTYYFEARSRNAAGPATSWTVYGGGTPTGVVIGAPTSGNSVTGTVTIPAGITPTGPLYVGYYNQSTGHVYGARIASPVTGANAFAAFVPTDTNPDYYFFGILDQNNDGLVNAGDVTNTHDNKNISGMAVTGTLTGQSLTLPSANSTATVSTQYYQDTYSGGSSTGYNLNINVREGNKLPVAVQLVSGPNVINPLDIGSCIDCGTPQFEYDVSLSNSVTPSVGDAYALAVTYSDGTSDTLTGTVTGWNSTSTLVGASDLATNLAPNGTSSTSTTPTFTWTYPTSASSYTYQFYLNDNSATIWQIPGNNSNLNGFPSTVPQIVWGTDPTGGGSTPTVGNLTGGSTYNWTIQVQDASGNSAQTQVYYIP